MMNDMIKDLFERKSVRVIENKPIEAEKKQRILEAAAQAPTAGNQQLYTILDITDNDMKKQLVETCDHQPFIATAPLVLIFCADCKKWYDAFQDAKCQPRKPAVGDLFLAIDDIPHYEINCFRLISLLNESNTFSAFIRQDL